MINEKRFQKWRSNGSQSNQNRILKFTSACLFILIFLAGCDGTTENGTSDSMSAVWDKTTSTLKVSGNTSAMDSGVTITDAADGTLIGNAYVDNSGDWNATATVPACSVNIESTSGSDTIEVDNAPANCTSSESYARAISNGGELTSEDDIPVDVLFTSNPVANSTIPNAVILNPPQNISISVGQVINFQGTAVGTAVQPPFSFYWDFGGAASNAAIQNPGNVRFDVPGTYFVRLSVSDNIGSVDPTPATRTITVNNSNSPIGLTPTPQILSPTQSNSAISVNVGESLFFAGTATDSLGSTSFTFEWDFSGIYPNQFGASVGSIPFNRAGTYIVSLYATNQQGIRSVTPAMITVMVGTNTGLNQAPTGTITRPRNDVTINVGESLKFKAKGDDPDNNNPLKYSWDFQGVRSNIDMSNKKTVNNVVFNSPGVYFIRMTVTDALGISDPNPPVRMVTVQNTTVPPIGGGNAVLSTIITSPPSNISIAPGQQVFFSGQAVSTTNTGPLQYFWNFDGAAVDSNLQTPGQITFPRPGQYQVTLFATDITGAIVGIPDSRTITVSDPSSIDVSISSPLNGSTVNTGTPVVLNGQVQNSRGFSNLRYEWSIKQRGSNNPVFTSTLLSPGNYVFTNPGSYSIKLKVRGTDSLGNNTVSSSAKSRITVVAGPVGSPGPISTGSGILLPSSDMVLFVGNTVDFEANRISGTNIRYNWNFGALRPPSDDRNPRPISLTTQGTYLVTLQITGTGTNGLPLAIFDQRTIQVLQQNSTFPGNPLPNAGGQGILLPTTDMVINAGEFVDFEARGFPGTGISYRWDFGGASAPRTIRNPQPIMFSTPGTFLVTLLVTGIDTAGIPLNVFDQRSITVLGNGGGFPFPTPTPSPTPSPIPLGTGILSPVSDVVINVGGSVDFQATSVNGFNVTYQWNFAGVRAPSNQRNPAPLRFNSPGSFLISVRISGTDLNGAPLNAYDHRVVTVNGFGSPSPFPPTPSPFPPPITPPIPTSIPEGFITQPTQSVVNVRVGEPVVFSGNGFDPLGVGQLNFQWSFGGARRNIDSQNPGTITFNRVGTFVVTLLVKNAFGQFDQTPPTVVVSVTP